MDEDEIYDITHGWWRIGSKREQAQYALAVAKGKVRAVFEVHEWRPRLFEDDGVTASESPRWGFDGTPAREHAHLIGLDVSSLFPQGAANPVRYVNIDEDSPSDHESADAAPAIALAAITSLSTQIQSLAEICHDLAAEPLLAASLGSKELFHSNLIGWLMERAPEVALAALEPWLEAQPA
jgi:hypothetical protein